MKNLLNYLCLLVVGFNAHAGCLDGLTQSETIVSKIRGFYVNANSHHYVILDKQTCQSIGSGITLVNLTKNHYYIQFDESNQFLASSLLTAYAKGDVVGFVIGSEFNGANKIMWASVPYSAYIN